MWPSMQCYTICSKGGLYHKVKLFLVFTLILFVTVQIYILYDTPHQVIDQCNSFAKACHPYAKCISTHKSYVCICKDGYFGDGISCQDIDECMQGVDTCSRNMKCKNTIGGYICHCPQGFYLSNNECTDIDECQHVNCPAGTYCLNTYGSYVCKCKEYHVYKDGKCEYDTDLCQPKISLEFPHCLKKYKWMKEFWTSHSCYAKHGVTGSDCTVMEYLADVEGECPDLPGNNRVRRNIDTSEAYDELRRFNSANLFSQPIFSTHKFVWIRNRCALLWNDWVKAYKTLRKKQDVKVKTPKQIFIFIGILSDQKRSWEDAKRTGPIPELVQWADLIASTYLLGHHLYIATDPKEILKGIELSTPCTKKRTGLDNFDLIYIDIFGLKLLKKANINFNRVRCKIRILDSFGTEARFNYHGEIEDKLHSIHNLTKIADELEKNPYGYGRWHMNLKQFFTMFPHSPDNSFLGFVVGREVHANISMEEKKDIAMVYGKQNYMFKGRLSYLKNLKKYVKLHGAVMDNTVTRYRNGKKLPPEKVPEIEIITNHKLLPWEEYQNYLKKAKVFVGLGYPFEGISPLEAVANGATFLSPKWDPPLSRLHDKKFNIKWAFEGKPTLRELTSQHSYMETFIGKPHVYTVNITNSEEVEQVMKEILRNHREKKISPYLPYEFTHEGMLQRVRSYIENQDFCDANAQWPRSNSLKVVISKSRETCKDACFNKGLVCDNALFMLVNEEHVFGQNQISCESFNGKKSLLAPYYDIETETCTLQTEPLLFSCVDAAPNYQRICPCREYIRGQVALCPSCR